MHGDADYLFDPTKSITFQSRSDIIRLALLNRYGGVWADSTMLCLEPLDSWLPKDNNMQSGLWMYHGNGGRFVPGTGPASWFIISLPGSQPGGYMIQRWKAACDAYWHTRTETGQLSHWMDVLFTDLFNSVSARLYARDALET